MKKSDLIIVRGAGDLATGTIHRLKKSGFHLLVLETDHPAAIRRQVALSEAVYSGSTCVENVEAVRIESVEQMRQVWEKGKVPVLVDPKGESIRLLKPKVVVDAILAKKNLGTTKDMAPLTIGLGPGFCAGADVDVVIETIVDIILEGLSVREVHIRTPGFRESSAATVQNVSFMRRQQEE